MMSLSKLRAAVLMALHESPAMLRRLATVHVHAAILLWSALAEGLRVDASVWLLQLPELLVRSFSSFPGCTSCTRVALVTALAGAWWSVRHPRLSHACTDRPVCVSGGAIFVLPCSSLPSSEHVWRHGRRSRIPIAWPWWNVLSVLLSSSCSCHCCRFTAPFQLFTWHSPS